MASGAFNGSAFNGHGFNIAYAVAFSIQETFPDSASFEASAVTSVTFEVTEAQDEASFIASSLTLAGFSITEASDIATFELFGSEYVFVTFGIVEGQDTASFSINSTTHASFSIQEAKDTLEFLVASSTHVEFELQEITDSVRHIRIFASFYNEGDAHYLTLPYEKQTITLPPASDRGIVPTQDVVSNVPHETQRINVAQLKARRKGDQ